LNCEQGPTDTPCGTCASCVELSRDGGGSLDVVEIDAASHNGVDDARELRERAVFAPARDRFKIFILDEAHMVTPQGFNALLKIVEEPPEHVKFIFATTEPDKVIGTIRSRTHHYPFRLVPPAELLRYVEQMCSSEGVAVEEGVLPLVVRAGGGSVRDTLSVLDQLIAGSPDATVTYDRAVALLGYTHGELLAEVMTAIAAGDGPGSFHALDKVIHSGQDPRRFAEDLLEFTRDIIVVDAAGSAATALLPGTSAPVIDQMTVIAGNIGGPKLSGIADVINDALMAMTGATSPKLHLELLMARLLVSIGAPATPHTAVESPLQKPAVPANASQPAVPEPVAPEPAPAAPAEPLSLDLMLSSWGKIVEAVGEKKRAVWTALANTEVVALVDDVVTIGFPSLASAEILKKPQGPGLPASAELVRDAILAVSGHRVRFKVQELAMEPVAKELAETVAQEAPVVHESTASASWPTVTLPGAEEQPAEEVVPEPADGAPGGAEAEEEAETPTTGALSQVGEAVIREVLGGQLISEHPVDAAEDK
jgi:DNA polymerase-3 subunit gamma/tau